MLRQLKKPIVISTWKHGFQATEIAMNILKNDGLALDAVELGVMSTESDPTVRRYVGKSSKEHRDVVKKKLKRLKKDGQRFCLITDEWTCGPKRRRYQNVKLHIKGNIFLDNNN